MKTAMKRKIWSAVFAASLYILSFSIARWLRDLVSVSSIGVQVFAHQEEQREVENREGNSWSNKEPDQD